MSALANDDWLLAATGTETIDDLNTQIIALKTDVAAAEAKSQVVRTQMLRPINAMTYGGMDVKTPADRWAVLTDPNQCWLEDLQDKARAADEIRTKLGETKDANTLDNYIATIDWLLARAETAQRLETENEMRNQETAESHAAELKERVMAHEEELEKVATKHRAELEEVERKHRAEAEETAKVQDAKMEETTKSQTAELQRLKEARDIATKTAKEQSQQIAQKDTEIATSKNELLSTTNALKEAQKSKGSDQRLESLTRRRDNELTNTSIFIVELLVLLARHNSQFGQEVDQGLAIAQKGYRNAKSVEEQEDWDFISNSLLSTATKLEHSILVHRIYKFAYDHQWPDLVDVFTHITIREDLREDQVYSAVVIRQNLINDQRSKLEKLYSSPNCDAELKAFGQTLNCGMPAYVAAQLDADPNYNFQAQLVNWKNLNPMPFQAGLPATFYKPHRNLPPATQQSGLSAQAPGAPKVQPGSSGSTTTNFRAS